VSESGRCARWRDTPSVRVTSSVRGHRKGFRRIIFLVLTHGSLRRCAPSDTCTGSCICSKSDHFPYLVDVNPECPVAGHSATVVSVDFSPDGKHFVSGSHDKVVKIWGTETGAEVSKFWDFVVCDEVMGVVTAVVPSRVCPGSRLR